MQNIPLNLLTVSEKYNVRLTEKDKQLGELVSSIRTHGLLENLLVIKGDNDNFEVIAGSRRFSALRLLEKEGYIPANYDVRCEIVSEENAVEISIAENTVRVPMHPADQYEAFARLVSEGMNTGDIAARFGITEKHVIQMLKLGRVSPQLMEAYRQNIVKLDSLMAFAITDDTEKQEEVFNCLKDSWRVNDVSLIRSSLTETSVDGNHKLVIFVGEAEYERAGGIITHDLFCERDSNYFDKELLIQLAENKLQQKADELQEKWAWVIAKYDFGYDEEAQYHIIRQHKLENIPQEVQSRYEEIEAMLQEIEDSGEEYEESETLIAEYEKLKNSMYGFSEEEYSIAGCVVTIGRAGNLVLKEGLLKPEDREQYFNDSRDQEEKKPIKEKQRYSNPLLERLKNYRLHPVRMAMASNFNVAFDAALYVMCNNTFGGRHNYKNTSWLKTQVSEYYYPASIFDNDETGQGIKNKEEKTFKKLPLAWLEIEDAKESFAALSALDEAQKQKLFAACIAKSLQPQLSNGAHASPVFEEILQLMQVDIAKHIRPTADNFFSRVAKIELLTIGKEIFGNNWFNNNQSKTKGNIVSLLHRAFANPVQKGHKKEQQELLNNWLPEGM